MEDEIMLAIGDRVILQHGKKKLGYIRDGSWATVADIFNDNLIRVTTDEDFEMFGEISDQWWVDIDNVKKASETDFEVVQIMLNLERGDR